MESIIGYETGKLIAGRYQVVRLLGVGAMGIVFEVVDLQLGSERLALKLLHPHLVVTKRALDRFKNETLFARKLLSPSVVRLFEFGRTNNDQVYITMELVEGVCLADILEQGALELDEALSIVCQIAEGLQAAHDVNIVHRDVKPQNILISKDGVAKLSDFGTARMIEGSDNLTRTGEAVGTPQYMSPEQFRAARVDPRTDVYSLGITLYEILTGEKPFEADSFLNLALKQLKEPTPNICEINKDIPVYIMDIISKATEKDPDRRFQSMTEFIDEIVSKISESRTTLETAKLVFDKANALDKRLIVKRRNKRILNSIGIGICTCVILLWISTRADLSLMMKVNIPLLKLKNTNLDSTAKFFGHLFNLPSDMWDKDIFTGIKQAKLSSRVNYAQIAKIRAKIDLSSRDQLGRTPLMFSYIVEQTNIAKEILESHLVDIDAQDPNGMTALMFLVKNNSSQDLKMLLDYQANTALRNIRGMTALHLAAERMDSQIVRMLIENNLSILHIQDIEDNTAFHNLINELIEQTKSFRQDSISEIQYQAIVERFFETLKVFIALDSENEIENYLAKTPRDLLEELYQIEPKYLGQVSLILDSQ